MMRHPPMGLLAGLLIVLSTPGLAATDAAEDAARWDILQGMYFKDRPVEEAGALIRIDAPARAHDAALVPVRIEVEPSLRLKSLSLLVDKNPVPLAATFRFGPASAGSSIETRVRVNEYTNLHAVGETQDGRFLMTVVHVKAAGGCSAPAVKDPQEAMARLGRIKVKLPETLSPGSPATAQVMVSHPNSSGLQFDQVSRTYIPAHYIQSIIIRAGGQTVLEADTDISISEDPNLRFSVLPTGGGSLEVVAQDTKGATFTHSVPLTTGAAKGDPAL
ncbi:quinoprotein dehydrogenase-associated SoxYZ-like carrier [Azospirillum melinis]|uniref:Quinoprotein dehydrogenase-associated SoxYZ-like carrier n=1 Tax=Azospirillum melinis TaxID=328839 RepID=A0ABX2K683_9PROT|nr:quinoprotein dehydrogenase-associated SoxYZ-like carrier [Azospirillum melinis]MBP2306445.1 sulfur-oxidizing protein SoxY [Azospirillum melinis]NUA98197.1 quinoprotein dehydrogenase-associated SoxYZ-like carrier [Azospirillum melinis]